MFSSNHPALIAAFHKLPSVTPSILRTVLAAEMLDHWDSWTSSDLIKIGLRPAQANELLTDLEHIDIVSTERQLDLLATTIVVLGEKNYPPYLAAISSPPIILYVRGSVDVLSRPSLAVVGTRRASPYGAKITHDIVAAIARENIVIVSGLAYGIDAIAHDAAVQNNTPTIGVMGTGIDRIYPWENTKLATQIISGGGAIITEFPLGTPPLRENFPQRNRIIAGLARAVWLVEAGEKSGALITMKFGLDENRDLYTLPADIHRPTAIGALNWLKLGAAPVTSPADFASTFPSLGGSHFPASISPTALDKNGVMIIAALDSTEPRHIDEISQACKLEASVVAAALALLELSGAVSHHGGMRYTSNS